MLFVDVVEKSDGGGRQQAKQSERRRGRDQASMFRSGMMTLGSGRPWRER